MTTTGATDATRKHFLYIVAPVLLMGVLVDQTSKSWASDRAVEPRILVPGYVAAYSVHNAGMILGFGRDRTGTSLIFSLFGIICASLIARIAFTGRVRWAGANRVAGALLLAGIFGNTVDRVALGHVRDFLVTWAMPTIAFNIADLLVVAGCASLFMIRFCGGTGSRTLSGSSTLAAT